MGNGFQSISFNQIRDGYNIYEGILIFLLLLFLYSFYEWIIFFISRHKHFKDMIFVFLFETCVLDYNKF
jgi:hypothetical protein